MIAGLLEDCKIIVSLFNLHFDMFINNFVSIIDKLPPISDRMTLKEESISLVTLGFFANELPGISFLKRISRDHEKNYCLT